MALVTRRYALVGYLNDLDAEKFAGIGASIVEQFPSNVVDMQVDDATPGAIANLDAAMARYGLKYVPTPPPVLVFEGPEPVATPGRAPLWLEDVGGGVQQLSAKLPGNTKVPVSSSGSLSIVDEAPASFNFDFATLGAVDWLYPTAYNTLDPKPIAHNKRMGGFLADSFFWASAGVATATDPNLLWVNTTTAEDNARGIALNGPLSIYGFTGIALNYGFRVRFPCSPTPRTLRFQGTQFGTDVLHSAELSYPGLANPVSLSTISTAVSGYFFRIAVTFAGPFGSWLSVNSRVSALHGVNNNIYVGAMGVS